MTILRMQNNELRRMIGELQKDNEETKAKQVRTKYLIDSVYNELFTKNDSLKLYEKTISDLRRALVTEKAYITTLQEQVGEVK